MKYIYVVYIVLIYSEAFYMSREGIQLFCGRVSLSFSPLKIYPLFPTPTPCPPKNQTILFIFKTKIEGNSLKYPKLEKKIK